MAAPEGNQFWKARSKHGRDKIFSDANILWEACVEYFEWVELNPLMELKVFATGHKAEVPKMRAMTISGICIFLNIDPTTWGDYRTQKDFSPVIKRAEEIIRTQKFAGAAADLLNPNIIARDLGLSDKREHTGAGGGPMETKWTVEVVDAKPTDTPKS